MQELQIFNFEALPVRTIAVENEPYFVGADVIKILGYKNGSRDLRRHVDEDDRIIQAVPQYQNGTLVSKTTLINESGLYSLIFSSKLDSAKRFKRWVTSEVLPAIRKHGIYATDSVIEQTIQNPDYIIHVLTEFKKEREGRLVAEQQVQELKPKATYYDLVLQNKSLLSVSKIAKDYGMSARALNKLLHELGVQYKQGDIWLLYAKHQDKGYTQTSTYALDEEHSKVTTKWTQKGRLFIYELLKNKGVLPSIEKSNVVTNR
ncbi:phage antirepressor [Staphylococcus pseudintermedius]|uniref:phage antirepressor n=1 Tax=Staphylococcus pseudintermedius TaxID=283734 RepID=UPI0011225C8F|nr:phage antirepressor [Staphylococcus pseudintermedius]EGQ3140940.1 phage antirepressor [Staphylococcus pseudintermedius]EJO7199736.1 phage antirepressor [Staphylococcus pseudintermedius]MDE9867447.1 phage antirepressor [Staphylococcus pseudintermedius]MDE9872221.1 phage antirepressor [Staphylococcus pseudintermedius]MDE9877268.1 phage antirepressor [Staphylococcus pseudintermedius]